MFIYSSALHPVVQHGRLPVEAQEGTPMRVWDGVDDCGTPASLMLPCRAGFQRPVRFGQPLFPPPPFWTQNSLLSSSHADCQRQGPQQIFHTPVFGCRSAKWLRTVVREMAYGACCSVGVKWTFISAAFNLGGKGKPWGKTVRPVGCLRSDLLLHCDCSPAFQASPFPVTNARHETVRITISPTLRRKEQLSSWDRWESSISKWRGSPWLSWFWTRKVKTFANSIRAGTCGSNVRDRSANITRSLRIDHEGDIDGSENEHLRPRSPRVFKSQASMNKHWVIKNTRQQQKSPRKRHR